MDAVVVSFGNRGGICLDVRAILCPGGSFSTSLRVGGGGYVSIHWEDDGRLPRWGGPHTDRVESG